MIIRKIISAKALAFQNMAIKGVILANNSTLFRKEFKILIGLSICKFEKKDCLFATLPTKKASICIKLV